MSFLSSVLGGQNGFTAQSATGDAKFQQQALLPDIQQNLIDYNKQNAQTSDIINQQGDLASQLKAQSMGQGPNIADLQLKQATDQNNKLAASQIASQRGMNPALAARLISQNQAANNQTAAGQSGVLRAQQQLSAQSGLANVYGQQAGESISQQGLSNQQLGINQQAQAAQNNAIVGAQTSADNTNANIAQQNANAAQAISSGLISGASTALMPTSAATKAVGKYKGGEIPAFLKGGSVPSMVSPGEKYLTAKEAAEVKETGESPMKKGKTIPGKASVEGDSIENDTVPAELEPGGVVLPRSVTQAEDSDSKAKQFMAALKSEQEQAPKGYNKILEMKRKMKEIHGHMEDLHDMLKEES